jgi:hypothetical protein
MVPEPDPPSSGEAAIPSMVLIAASPGQCKNMHGHRYVLEVTLEGDVVNAPGEPVIGNCRRKLVVRLARP